MSTDTSADAFLQGQGIPVELTHVESELMKLWGTSAEQVGGPELDHPTVTRVVLANLVIEDLMPGGEQLRETLDALMARFPCRSIVLHRSQESARRILAEVSALCHLPAPGLPQVCSEQIVLHAGPNAFDLAPGAVRPLLVAELPTVLWWRDDPRTHESLFSDLATEAYRLILDLPDPGTDLEALKMGLDPEHYPYSRDTAWFGITRWRELVAQFFDLRCQDNALERIVSVSVEAISPDPTRAPRMAAWLVSWLAGQLDWTGLDSPTLEQIDSGSLLQAAFQGPEKTINTRITTRSGSHPAIMGVTLQTRATEQGRVESFRLTRLSPESADVRIEVDAASYCTLPRVVIARELSPWRRVAAALESSRIDPPFQKARPHVLRLLGA